MPVTLRIESLPRYVNSLSKHACKRDLPGKTFMSTHTQMLLLG